MNPPAFTATGAGATAAGPGVSLGVELLAWVELQPVKKMAVLMVRASPHRAGAVLKPGRDLVDVRRAEIRCAGGFKKKSRTEILLKGSALFATI
jgi:hypothetical protein